MYSFIDVIGSDNKKISLEYLNSLEAAHNIHFPEVLRSYYLNYNCSTIKECRFEKHGLEFCVMRIYPLMHGTMPVEKIMKYNSTNEAIPRSFVPLAQDEDEDDYYWDSKTGKEHPIPICDSVEEFFGILKGCD